MSDPFALAGEVRLKLGRERPVAQGHPWIYRGALAEPLPAGTSPLLVCDHLGAPLATALPTSRGGSLALRVVARGQERWTREVLRQRLATAGALRRRLALDADAYRLVHAEGDSLSGLVIDVFAGIAVCEVFENAWLPFVPLVVEFLRDEVGVDRVLLRRGWERGALAEAIAGRLPDEPVAIREGPARFLADLAGGQKTGFFLDQRENRRGLARLAHDASVLNLFSYSGGFAVAALVAGASRAVNVDVSAEALALARMAYALNGLPLAGGDFVCEDVFSFSRAAVRRRESFDVVVVDPPAFVRRSAEIEAGMRGYHEVNLQAMRLVRAGGLLLTCSCSALVDESRFLGMLQRASADARRDVQLLAGWGAAPDHPVSFACLETRHLKALLCAIH